MAQPTLEPPQSRKEAKAQAAAAKAYAKAQGNWFTRHKLMSGLIALVAIVIVAVAAASSGGNSESATAHKGSGHHAKANRAAEGKTSGNSGQSVTGASAYGTAKLPLQNGDWRLDSVQVKNDGLGDFGATGRVTYTGNDQSGGDNIFTVTVFKGQKVVATLEGSANTVKPGTTVTVTFISSDNYVGGPYKYDFQNDL